MQLLNKETNIPGCETLLEPALFSQLMDRTFPNQVACRPKLKYVRYKPDTSCLVGYEIQRDGRREYWHAKGFRRGDWNNRRQKLSSFAGGRRDSVVQLRDDLACALFGFPVDSQLPALSRLVSDSFSDCFLQRVVATQFNDCIQRIDTLAYKPNRRFTGKVTSESGQTFVLKIYEPARFASAMQSAQILKRVKSPGPARLGRSNRHRCVALQWIDGESMSRLISNRQLRGVDIENTFEQLDQLHRTDVKPGALRHRHPTRRLAQLANYLAAIYTPSTNRVQYMAKALFELDEKTPYVPTLIHGDFHPGQVLSDGEILSFCDFDNACYGDPFSDIGNWLSHVRFGAIMGDLPESSCAKVFDLVHSYFQRSAGRPDQVARIKLNYLISLFRLAVAPFRSGQVDWQSKTERVIGEVFEGISAQFGKHFAVRSTPSEYGRPGPADDSWRSFNDPLKYAIKNDESLRCVVPALSCSNAQRVLEHSLPAIKRLFGNFQIVDIIAGRHKLGRRCLIEYKLDTDRGVKSILGKARAKGLDHRTLKFQSDLYAHYNFSDESHDRISVPRPLGAVPQWNMWFQLCVPGQPAGECLTDPAVDSNFRRIARGIAKLHQSILEPRRKHTFDDEWNILSRQLNKVADELPAHRKRLDDILRRCNQLANELGQCKAATCIHRDFYHDQVLVSKNSIHLIDLDLAAVGQPALDVGNFIAHLTELSVRQLSCVEGYAEAETAFVSEYLRISTECTDRAIWSCKILSLARLIGISRRIANRREHTANLIEAVASMMESCPSQFITVSCRYAP